MSQIELGNETISKLAKEIIHENKSIVKSESEKKLRNIRLLLTNYRYIKNHLDIEVPTMKDETQLSNYELSLYSLIAYRARSREMLIFLNSVLKEYKDICYSKSDEDVRRYKVIDGLYLSDNPQTVSNLAIKLSADIKTIRRDEKKAVKALSVMTFGIDGLNDFS